MMGGNDKDLGRILQKLEDIEGWVTKIEDQTRKTNGRVGEAVKDIAIIQHKQETCPARINHPTINQYKDWSMRKTAVLISTIVIILEVLNHIFLR